MLLFTFVYKHIFFGSSDEQKNRLQPPAHKLRTLFQYEKLPVNNSAKVSAIPLN